MSSRAAYWKDPSEEGNNLQKKLEAHLGPYLEAPYPGTNMKKGIDSTTLEKHKCFISSLLSLDPSWCILLPR